MINIRGILSTALYPYLQKILYFFAREIRPAGPALVIAPHPDDETLGCGATIMRLREAGQDVRVVMVVDGGGSGHSAIITPAQLSEIRRKEAIEAMRILGVAEEKAMFLNFPDMKASEHVGEIRAALAREVQAFKPKSVFSPYILDSHPDHRAVAAAADLLWDSGIISCPLYQYPLWFRPFTALHHLLEPRKLRSLRKVRIGNYRERKKKALEAHRSQYAAMTAEKGWFTLGAPFVARFFNSCELFFEKTR